MAAGLTIALDAMGGDNAPQMVIQGANIALRRLPQIEFILIGDEGRLLPLLRRKSKLAGRFRIEHADQVVTNDMKPSAALRSARRSSMRYAAFAARDVDAVNARP